MSFTSSFMLKKKTYSTFAKSCNLSNSLRHKNNFFLKTRKKNLIYKFVLRKTF